MSMIRNRLSTRSFVAALGYLCGVFALSVCLLIPFAPQTRAATGINRQINYQGRLLDASGAAVADGNYSIKFSLYDAVSGGNRLWSATGTVATPSALTISVSNGLFSVLLGDVSSGGGWQNVLNNSIDWNSDSLFLGVTVSSDAEMTPRRRLAAAPQAFNAENLQGMYASSSAFGGQSLFTIHQTSSTAATSSRTALEIRSEGTSSANDFLVQGINDLGSTVFSLNRAGNVTSSGYFAATGNGTSTITGNLSITGNTTSTNLFTVNGLLNNATSTWLGFTTASGTTGNIINLTSSNVTVTGGTINGTTIGATNASTGVFTNVTSTSATTTWLGFGTARGTTGNIIKLTSSPATISGGTINGTTIGLTNASTGIFT
ncbi:MAG: hypothetical protein Q8R07_05135, partial [Candidatus Uhrbacteria bacterium]|nr:hypothetical protein [Candidatus Uhrbacteria bacterium]